MNIKMNNEEITQSVDLLGTLKEKGRLGYAIMRNLRKMNEASTEYRNIKNDAIQKYGEKKQMPNGTEYTTVPKEKFPEFLEEIKDIATIEEEIDVFTVTEDEFCSGNLTSDQMNTLYWMVAEPEENAGE
ncbi:MAG: hypothetical protein LIO94_07350 [Clostridiales bacterium]|nr:hypothetical protein [Clostridiales bacterium]